MTPSELAARALPTVQAALRAAQPEVRAAVGPLRWAALAVPWKILTSGRVLLVLVRLGVELAVGFAAPWALPLLEALLPLVDHFLPRAEDRAAFGDAVSLLRTPPAQFSEAARAALPEPGWAPIVPPTYPTLTIRSEMGESRS